jgi:predicted PurR-regulated permease PerM
VRAVIGWGILLIACALALGWVLLPFYGAIMWGVIIAMLFMPMYRHLLARLNQRRNTAAAIVLLVVVVIGVVPFALITAALAREASVLYLLIDSGEWDPGTYLRGLFDTMPDWLASLLDRVGLENFDTLRRRLAAAFAQGSQFIATQALGIGLNTFGFVASLCIALYLAFFLVRDGDALAQTAWKAMPLAPRHKRELIDKFIAVVNATVKGTLLVAAIQGALGGLAFWFLGVRGPILWAVLMAFLSLLPMVGAGLVWLPVAAYFLLVGATWKAVMLVTYGLLVIGLIDNLLRPALVGREARMPDYLVMITTLGGMAVFGVNGCVIGPAVAAMFIAVWHIYSATQSADPSEPASGDLPRPGPASIRAPMSASRMGEPAHESHRGLSESVAARPGRERR